ncbi:phosphate transport system regulatory protein PhoU [Salinibacter sp. 10B]|uniref:phosphate signaling complex protein PhoU n=1 Tax=Salinibacter sp. 10B TaxID=1923971 RepID=UPI000CF4A64B|nr:phosphate signaling complex protein PhoU [Salinibacter sp. 10B]PQJ34841.1 phosphate transport system regulatory protein PhoU [Salinibacter sp. 10B]
MSNRSSLDQELALLRGLIAEMANHVDSQFADAMNALLQGDTELAEQVVEGDDAIDALELRIDEQCEHILALHSPVAVDLRMLIMAVKIDTDLERIGDHCSNLSRNARHLADAPGLLAQTRLPKMADMARTMLREAEDAFLENDRLKARKVIARDLQVNRLHDETFSMLVKMMEEGHEQAEALSHLLTVSKALERISDHAKNVAQGIVFMIEGRDIRHRGVDEEEEAAPNNGQPDASSDVSSREA